MAALSSTRMRGERAGGISHILKSRLLGRPRRAQRQHQAEGCAQVCARTTNGEFAAQFFGGQRAAVEAEAVPVATGGEAVSEDAREMFRRNAHSVVLDLDKDLVRLARADADGEQLVG